MPSQRFTVADPTLAHEPEVEAVAGPQTREQAAALRTSRASIDELLSELQDISESEEEERTSQSRIS